eukprot:977936-Amorphochlora_amoeboformis.AAC.1
MFQMVTSDFTIMCTDNKQIYWGFTDRKSAGIHAREPPAPPNHRFHSLDSTFEFWVASINRILALPGKLYRAMVVYQPPGVREYQHQTTQPSPQTPVTAVPPTSTASGVLTQQKSILPPTLTFGQFLADE